MTTSSDSVVVEGYPQAAATAADGPDKVNEEQKTKKSEKNNIIDDPGSSNLCVLCLEEQKRLACIPCGHLATCVPCGHSLRSCPICRRAIDAFVRIYI